MRPAVLIASLLAVSLVAAAISVGAPPKIRSMSHYHPPGAESSWVCAKLKGKPGKRVRAEISGPAVNGNTEKTFRFPGKKSKKKGKYTVSWNISQAGVYELTLTTPDGSREIDDATYTVPAPPTQGKYRCPAGHKKGWPRS